MSLRLLTLLFMKYEKILQLTNIEFGSRRLESLLTELAPICFFTPEKAPLFRNREQLVSILRRDFAAFDTLCKHKRTSIESGQETVDRETNLTKVTL